MQPDDQKLLADFLRFKVLKGFEDFGLPQGQSYLERINYELGIIEKMGYMGYFLIVADLCRFMRESKIRFLVRGSGCGSCVVWGLGISHKWLDPIQYGLPFERFLNPSRVSMPDLDIDIQDDRRDEVFEYTLNKYGKDRVARIITYGTLAAKAAIKDVARALNIPDYQRVTAEISALIPLGKGEDGKNVRLADVLKKSEALRDQQKLYPQLFEMAMKVEGKIRNASSHAAGVIIAPDTITNFVPLFFKGDPATRDAKDWMPTIQWDMYDAEDRGMLKMDFLGLKTLRVIDRTCRAIYAVHRAFKKPCNFDIDNIPRDDHKAWSVVASGRTAGIFQIERTFVQNFCRRMNLMRKDPWQLAGLVAIIRPGMMDGHNSADGVSNTDHYLFRSSGREAVRPPHPLLEKTFESTLGMMCFQEDVMWAAQDFSGFNMAEADILRKGVGKKNPEFIKKQKPMFFEGGQQPRIRVTFETPDGPRELTTKPRNPDLRALALKCGIEISATGQAGPASKDGQVVNAEPGYRQTGCELVMAGASLADCETIWANIEAHSRYSFNNAHAAAYGMIGSYETAYLKGNWPSLYMCELINSEAGVGNKEDGYNNKVAEYVEDARSMGLQILQPCVKMSRAMCHVDWPNKIRFGLTLIKRVGSSSVDWILKNCKQANSLKDFILCCYEHVEDTVYETKKDKNSGIEYHNEKKVWKTLTRVGKTDLEQLAIAGAFDCFEKNRSKILAMLPVVTELAKKYHEQSCKLKTNPNARIRLLPDEIMRELQAYDIDEEMIPNEHQMTLEQKLERERDNTGCFLSESPFAPFWGTIRGTIDNQQLTEITPAEIKEGDWNGHTVFPAILARVKENAIKNGNNKGRLMAHMGWVGVEGDIECPAWPDEWEKLQSQSVDGHVGDPNFPYMQRGKVYLVMVKPDRKDPTKAVLVDVVRLSNRGLGI